MIRVSKLNKEEFYINPHLIETIEKTPDTVVTLTTNKKYVVAETAEEMLAEIVEYYRIINTVPPQINYSPKGY